MSPNRVANSENATKKPGPSRGPGTNGAPLAVRPYQKPPTQAELSRKASNKVLADFDFVKSVVVHYYRDGTEITQYLAVMPGTEKEVLISETDLRLWQAHNNPLVVGKLRQSQIDSRGIERLGLKAPVNFSALTKEQKKVILLTASTFRKEKPEESSPKDEEKDA